MRTLPLLHILHDLTTCASECRSKVMVAELDHRDRGILVMMK
jgi:hypothetical protein